jgi:hypothetical protein
MEDTITSSAQEGNPIPVVSLHILVLPSADSQISIQGTREEEEKGKEPFKIHFPIALMYCNLQREDTLSTSDKQLHCFSVL